VQGGPAVGLRAIDVGFTVEEHLYRAPVSRLSGVRDASIGFSSPQLSRDNEPEDDRLREVM
jgi:hypothetical protein